MTPEEDYRDLSSTIRDEDIHDIDQNSVVPSNRPISYRKLKGDTRKKRDERKERRNLGKSYETRSGKLVQERTLKPLNMCRNRCVEKVCEETRQHIFTNFWAMRSYNRRAQFIAGQIEVMDKKCTRIRNTDLNKQRYRQSTVLYHLPINGTNIRTCKTCFVKTFDVSNKFIETVLNKKRAVVTGIVSLDQRGNHSNKKKTSDIAVENARRHLLSIPVYESHYTRRDSSKKYLPSHYTLASLYAAYKIAYPQKPVNRKLYEKLFHELNITIKKPKKDTCSTCDKLTMQIKMAEEKNELQAALAQHHLEADLGYTSKSADKEFSRNDPSKKTITFDLQQCLPTPDVHNSIAFYKRQLWTFDLTIHDCDTGQAYAYIRHEALAKRGGNEIGSCLYQFLTNDLDKNVKHVVMYSDCCGGQNKNSHIAVMCMVALQDSSHLEVIDHKFLISGHTHMECDTDHSLIEKQKKKFNGQLEHPHDWANLIRQTGKKKPFIVKELERNNFYNFSGLLKNGPLINRKTDTDGDKINWRELRWIRYEKGSQTLLAKTTFSQNEPFRVLDFKRRGKQL
nr:unnamed protein product [Callosobruchus chinensis]